METTYSRVEEIAEEVANWECSHQEALLKKLADLNYRQGLKKLSEKIQQRLKAEGKLQQSVDEIFAEMARIREEIATSEYQQ